MGKKRRTFSSKEKSKITLAALQERKTGAEIAKEAPPRSIQEPKERTDLQSSERVFQKKMDDGIL